VARSIIKQEKSLCTPFGVTFERINRAVNLAKQVIRHEIPITIFSCLEEDSGVNDLA
jgi:hypothetical protein